ncbi:MAG: peptidyl-prolyl cis-trans isomerase [Deltaproteobacteria bacterium]|nr:peptidyl-prolyl cis-trans isomerase [Deltaproteobacteria bacterium]
MKRFCTSLIKSPVLHFILLGTVVFVAYTHLKPPDRETIRITTQTIDALVRQRESITQNPTTSEERQIIIEGHIQDEILLREAYKRGFDKNDYRVRKRILNIMRTSLSEVIPEPTVAQLRAFYAENKERYLTSPSRSFEQVYFSFASAKQPENPVQFLEKLEGMSDISSMGEFSPVLGNRFSIASFQTTAITFGKPFAQVVFEMGLNEWRGPIESFRGIHYVRVTAQHEPELPPFEQMESYLRSDYFLQKGRESQQAKIDELRKNYGIVVEGAETIK